MVRKKEFQMSKDDLAYEEPMNESFSDGFITPKGECVAAFNFSEENNSFSNDELTKDTSNYISKRNLGTNGVTPPIDGEFLYVKRSYLLRASTVRKINKLKSMHPELNTYVSTIVDMAINKYYDYVISNEK